MTLLALLAVVPAQAQYATGGSGLYRSNIIWFTWGTPPNPVPQAGQTVINNYTVAGQPLVVTCSLSNIAGSGADPDLIVYSPGTFVADGLENLYNIGGTGAANTLDDGLEQRTAGTTVSFDFSCSATLSGQPYALSGLVFADAETSTTNESIQVTIPPGSTYRMIERYRAGCTDRYQIIANAAGTTYRTSSPDGFCNTGSGPMGIGFIDGATSGSVIIGGTTGETAIALGVMLDGADHGDAPASYGDAAHLLQNSWTGGTIANGATQDVFAATFTPAARQQPALHLGNSVDTETANQPSATASGDDSAGSDDEDGLIPGSVTLLPGATTAQVAVTVVNATPNPATLAGWIDFNNNGTFEPGERTQVTIPPNTNTATPFTLNWSGLAPLPISFSSFARFRVATNPADVASPTGLAVDGEVEDYRVPTVPAFATCDSRAFLFQATPTDIFSIDLVTGGSVQVGTDVSPVNINAVGYNPLDNYIYGMDSAVGGTGLIRVGADFTVQTLGFPTGLPSTGFNVGEFDNNGHYWVTSSAASTTVYEVDMKPGSPTYFTVVSARPLTTPATLTAGADWAFNPIDGFLYRTPTNTGTGRVHLLRYNRATGVQTDLGAVAGIAADPTIVIGADYADAAGFVYGSDNASGRIFRINTATNSGALLSNGPVSGTNDGARCFNAPVPIDFGDAPDTFGTLLASNGARHSIPGFNAAAKTAPLMLGSRISVEADGQPSSDASLDTFDDGLVPGSVSLLAGATTAQVIIKAVNAKATPATLAGWIDFNNNGTFQAGERAQVTVPANTATATSFTLNWTGLTPLAAGFSAAARFRIATTAAQVTNPTGAASDGEVEDYVVPVTLPVVDCSTNPSIFNTSINASGGILPPGSRDRNWDVGLGSPAGGPASVASWIDAYVTGNAVPGAWANSPFGNADWISFFPNANQGGANVDEYHRYRFTLDPAVVPGSFSLGIDFYADNSVWEVYVNGQPQSGLVAGLPQYPANPYFSPGFVAGNQAHLTLNHSWQTGNNEIVVQVKSGPGFVGFLGQVTSTGLCPAQIGITKSANPAGVLTPGGTVTYTVTATNTGLVPAPNTIINDPLPAGLTSGTWTCAGSGGAVCPNASGNMPLNQTIATFPGGGVLTYTITGSVAASPPANVANTVTATPPGNNGQCFPDNTPPPCSATVSNPPVPVVSIAKTTPATQAVPGGPLTYSVTVRNTGSVAAGGTTLSDPLPAGLSAVTWTCVAAGGAVCPNASGSGAINETIATFPAGGQLVYTINAIVDDHPPASIANTASTTPPGGGICADGTNAPCTATVILPSAPQISVMKSANPPGVVTPGGTVTYTIIVSNDGSTPAPSTLVRDSFPNGIVSATWTCVSASGAVCPNANSGGAIAPPADLLNESILTFPAGGSVTYTITATVSASPPASVVNTVSVDPPGGVCLPANSPPPCSSTVSNPPVPIISVTKTVDSTLLIPGGTVTYTITVGNTGSVAADGTLVSDPIPAGLTTPYTWACADAGGAICPNASGSGAINESIATFPAGGAVAYIITATVAANPPANVGNIVSVTPPDGICADGSPVPCTATTDTPVAPQVSIAKTSNATILVPGGTVTWTLTVSNVGNADADGTQVADPLPAGIVSATWTCAASGGALCANASGNGGVNDIIGTFPAGSSVVYTIVATVSANPPAVVTNTATTTPPTGGLCMPGNTPPPCSGTVSNPPAAQVSITKTSSAPGALTPGGTVTYTVTATNTGSVAAPGTIVADPIPAGITAYAWTCAATGGAVCPNASGNGALNETLATFPAGSNVVYTIVATVSANPPAIVTNIATTTPPTGGLCLPGNTPPPCSGTVSNPPSPQVSITKTSSEPGALTPGGTVTYTVTATNSGAINAPGTIVADPIPAGITAYAWTCAANGGAVCPNASGAGAINETLATFPAGSSVVYTIVATVSANPPAVVTNIATTTPPTGGLCLPGNTPPPCSGTVSNPPAAQVSITKTSSAPGALTPGGTVTYTVTATNSGSVAAPGTIVADPIPAGITAYAWTCAASGGAVCPNANGAGALNETLATFPAGSNVVYTIVATVSANPPAVVTNIATTTPPTGGLCLPGNTPPPCSGTVSNPPSPQVSITKTSSVPGALTPGGTVTYTVTATNSGAIDAPGTIVADPIPAGITAYAWTCAASGGAVCPNANGSGGLNETIATFPAGSSVVYTIVATVSANPPAVVTNIATTTPPTGGLCLPGNTPPPCSGTVSNPPSPQVSITKTSSAPGALTPGGTVTYTVTATNSGAIDAPGTIVADPIPVGITAYAWTCAASGGAVCPNASGSGALNEAIATFPAGSSVVYTIVATVSANPPAIVTNIATTTPPTGGLCLPGNTPPPCSGTVSNPPSPQVSITKTSSAPGALTPGGTVTYTVTATNSGAIDAPGTIVADPIPVGITAYAWTCAASGGAVCPNASGSGALNEAIATFPAGSSVVYTIVATVSANPPAIVTNIATTTPPTGGLCLPGNTPPPCSGTVSNPPSPQVSITKTSSAPGALTPGGTVTYTVTATNSGAIDAPGTIVADPIPAGITAYAWTCAASGGAVCPNASGNGALNETLATFPAGSNVVYTIVATVSANPPAIVTNIATTTPPTGGLCLPGNTPPPCSGTVSNPPSPQVSITKTSSVPGALTPGGTVTYTVAATNSGVIDAPGTIVADPIPAGITAYAWTCAANGGAVCPNASGTGAINETIATFPAGSSVVYTIVATVSANPPAVVTNIATTTPPTGGLCLPGNTPPPCSGTVSNPPAAQVSITKTSSAPGALTPGGTVTYTVTASNVGATPAPGTVVADPIPAGITAYAWTCAANGGAVCPNASGAGALNETIATFPAGSSVVYTIVATVSANPPAVVTNIATTTPPTGSLCLPGNTPPPCSGTVSNPPTPQVSITKTSSAPGALTPGGTVTYTVTATNSGAIAAPGTIVTDPIPAGITAYAWTCAASGGAVCPNASGGGAINETIATFPAGSSVVYTIIATVSANPPAVVTNIATTTPPTGGLCLPGNTPPPCSGIVTNPPTPLVTIAKTSSAAGALPPGGSVTYTVTATNSGSVAAPGTVVSDPIPAGIVAYAWTCAASGGAVCPHASGSGALNETIATFPAGSVVVYTIVATVSANPPAIVTNTATTSPPGGLCLPGNTPPPCSGTVSNPPLPQVGIGKTVSAPNGAVPNGFVTYTVTAMNSGTVAAPNTLVSDPIPAGFTAYAWTCVANGGAVCPNASGNGALNETIATFPAGSSVVYTIVATISANPPSTLTNLATVTPPTGGLCLPGNTPPPCAATVSVVVNAPVIVVPTPINARWMLVLLGMVLLMLASARLRKPD